MRWWRWGLISLLLMVFLLAGTACYVAFQGKRDWAATRDELIRRGEKLTVAELAPKPLADERNFFGDTIWREIAEKPVEVQWDGSKKYASLVPASRQKLGILSQPVPSTEIEELKKKWPQLAKLEKEHSIYLGNTRVNMAGNRAMDQTVGGEFALAVLKPAEPVLDRITELLQRPEAQFSTGYSGSFYGAPPHLDKLRIAAAAFKLRARVELQSGRGREAARDVLAMLGLARVSRGDFHGISHSTRLWIFDWGTSAIAAGQASHAWSEADLKAFDESLASEGFLPGLCDMLRWNRAEYNGMFDRAQHGAYREMALVLTVFDAGYFSSQDWEWRNTPGTDIPVKVYVPLFSRYDQACVNRLTQGALDAVAAKGWREMNTNPAFQLPAAFESDLYAMARPISERSTTGLTASTSYAAHAQDQLVQARLVFGLERYYLKQKSYPETLAELVPDYLPELPAEVLTEKPMHYRRTEPGAFVLWADGWDGIDDLGKPNERYKLETGDWVWGKP